MCFAWLLQTTSQKDLKYGEAKKQLCQSDSERTGDQASTDSDIDIIRLRYKGTEILQAGVNRNFLKFAGICIGNTDKVSEALVKAVAGSSSKLRTPARGRMIPFLNSPLVKLQHKLSIMQFAAGERTLCGFS